MTQIILQLTPEEWKGMRSQTVTSYRRKLTAIPYAFTEDKTRKAKHPIGFL